MYNLINIVFVSWFYHMKILSNKNLVAAVGVEPTLRLQWDWRHALIKPDLRLRPLGHSMNHHHLLLIFL